MKINLKELCSAVKGRPTAPRDMSLPLVKGRPTAPRDMSLPLVKGRPTAPRDMSLPLVKGRPTAPRDMSLPLVKGRPTAPRDISLLFTGVSIDSRKTDLKGKIFFAIHGENLDGHDFAKQALEGGARAVVVHKTLPAVEKAALQLGSVVIQVPDTLKALHSLTSYWRAKNKARVIGITGSTGKTTTKNFCYTLLQSADNSKTSNSETIIAGQKSFNNRFGVPLTLLSIRENTDIVIQEIGMNQKGEIKALCALARPDIVTVTQVGHSHVGMLGGQEQIAREKEQIYISSPEAVKVFNLDNSYTRAMYEKYKKPAGPTSPTGPADPASPAGPPSPAGAIEGKELLRFSAQDKKADVFFKLKEVAKDSLFFEGHIQGVQGRARVLVTGPAHLNNLLASSALAVGAGVSPRQIWERLALCHLPKGRNQWVALTSGARALFDAYNASPESVIALLEYFLSPVVEGKKVVILGDFLELNSYLPVLQKQVAQKLTIAEVSIVWFIGSQAGSFKTALQNAGCKAECYFSAQFDCAVADKILSCLDPSFVLAFKASRRIGMENIIKHFHPKESLDLI